MTIQSKQDNSFIHQMASGATTSNKRLFVEVKKKKLRRLQVKIRYTLRRTCAASNRSRDSSINAQRGNLPPPPFAWQSDIHVSSELRR